MEGATRQKLLIVFLLLLQHSITFLKILRKRAGIPVLFFSLSPSPLVAEEEGGGGGGAHDENDDDGVSFAEEE